MATLNFKDRIRVELDSRGVARVTLARPEKHNGLDFEMIHALGEASRHLRRERGLRAVVLHGDGPSFCAGLDFKTVMAKPVKAALGFAQLWLPWRNGFQNANLNWRDLPVPVIAAIHGNCFGGGMQLALAADFRIATPDSKLSIMESKWGLIPDMGGTVTLRHLLPRDVAMELTMTGRVISGTEGRELGLVTKLADDPLAAAEALVQEILTRSPDAIAATKRLFDGAWFGSERGALAGERRWQRKLLGSKNQRIAIDRNLKKLDTPYLQRRIR